MATYYVHPLGSDAGAGTIGDPLLSCAAAIGKAGTGHTYLLAEGMNHSQLDGQLFGVVSKASSTFGTYPAADSPDDRPGIDGLVWIGNPSSPYWLGWTYHGDRIWSGKVGVGNNDIALRMFTGSQVLGGGLGVLRSQRILGEAEGRALDQVPATTTPWTTIAQVKATITSARIWYSSDATMTDPALDWNVFVRASDNTAIQPPEYFGGLAFMIPVPAAGGNVGSPLHGLRYRNSATPLIWRDIDIIGTTAAAIGASDPSSTVGVDGMDLRNFDILAWHSRGLHFNNNRTDANRVAVLRNSTVRNVTVRTLATAREYDTGGSEIFHGNEAVEVSNGVINWSGKNIVCYGAGHGGFSLQSNSARLDNTGNTDPAPMCQDVVLEDSVLRLASFETDARGLATGGLRVTLRNVEIYGQSTGSQLHQTAVLENVRWYGCVAGTESGSGQEAPVRANPFTYSATLDLFPQVPVSIRMNGCLIESVDPAHTCAFMMRVNSASNNIGAGVVNVSNTLFVMSAERPYIKREIGGGGGTYSVAQSFTGCAVVSPTGLATIDDNGAITSAVNGALGASGNARYTTAAAQLGADLLPALTSPLKGTGVAGAGTWPYDANGNIRWSPPTPGPVEPRRAVPLRA